MVLPDCGPLLEGTSSSNLNVPIQLSQAVLGFKVGSVCHSVRIWQRCGLEPLSQHTFCLFRARDTLVSCSYSPEVSILWWRPFLLQEKQNQQWDSLSLSLCLSPLSHSQYWDILSPTESYTQPRTTPERHSSVTLKAGGLDSGTWQNHQSSGGMGHDSRTRKSGGDRGQRLQEARQRLQARSLLPL